MSDARQAKTGMVYLTDVGRTDLVAAVRNYLEHVPNVHAAEKDGYFSGNSAYLSNFLSRTFCSSARPPPDGHEYPLEIHDLSNAHGGLGPDVARVLDFNLLDDHVESIHQTLQRKRGISVVYLSLRPDIQGNHATLLVFDARTKKQHYFNPWGYTQHWINIAFATRPNVLVNGFTPATAYRDAWANVDVSLQSRLDQNHHGVDGNCALYCILIGILCTRFGVGRPRVMADIVVEAMQQIDLANGYNPEADNPAHSHMSRMWNWMNTMSDVAKRIRDLPVLYPYSVNTEEMVQDRHDRRQEASKILHDYPPLLPPIPNSYINRRVRLRNRQINYLNASPALQEGELVTAEAVAEREQTHRQAERDLIRMMFPPSANCQVLLRSGNLCSRRACVGQPLCWQHKFLTRNHQLTGQGRMRCSAAQQACIGNA